MTTRREKLWWMGCSAKPADDEFHIPTYNSFCARPLPPARGPAGRRFPLPSPRTLSFRLTQAAVFVGAVLYTALQLVLLALAIGALPLFLLLLGAVS